MLRNTHDKDVKKDETKSDDAADDEERSDAKKDPNNDSQCVAFKDSTRIN